MIVSLIQILLSGPILDLALHFLKYQIESFIVM